MKFTALLLILASSSSFSELLFEHPFIVRYRAPHIVALYKNPSSGESIWKDLFLNGNEEDKKIDHSLFLNGDQTLLTFSSENDGKIWDLKAGTVIRELEKTISDTPPSQICLAPNKKKVAIVYNGSLVPNTLPSRATVWDLDSGAVMGTYHMASGIKSWCKDTCIWTCAFSPDSQNLLLGGYGTLVEKWSLESRQLVQTIRSPRVKTNAVLSISYSEDGSRLLVTDDDGVATVFDASLGSMIWQSEQKATGFTSMRAEFLPTQNWVVASYDFDPPQIWDIASGQLIRTFEPFEGCSYDGTFAPNSQISMTLSTDRKWLMDRCRSPLGSLGIGIRVWNLETGKALPRE